MMRSHCSSWYGRTVAAAVALVLASLPGAVTTRADAGETGVLLLAHGGRADWNAAVTALAQKVDSRAPTEVAFGMATRATIQTGIDRLVQRGVKEIVAVPLFVSSHSTVIDATEYLLGARTEAPPALKIFARMNHGPAASTPGHAEHGAADPPAEDGTRPVQSPVPIRMTAALNQHPIVADILASRAKSISRDPAREVAIIVAHGPVSDAENALWLADMKVLAEKVGQAIPFRRVDYLTVRDDAPPPLRAQATADFRQAVARATDEGARVLIVPLLMSFGGIEAGIRTRLEGLDYAMAAQGLVPDDRIATWVLEIAGLAARE
jgi:sirohydrochlorin ferrochelatase